MGPRTCLCFMDLVTSLIGRQRWEDVVIDELNAVHAMMPDQMLNFSDHVRHRTTVLAVFSSNQRFRAEGTAPIAAAGEDKVRLDVLPVAGGRGLISNPGRSIHEHRAIHPSEMLYKVLVLRRG